MSCDPYCIELDPDTNTSLKVYLVRDVKNVQEIKSNIVQGLWKCAVVKPCLIVDPFQLAVAANKAVLAEKLGTMMTRNVFAEILFNLSLSKKITQSLSKFGIEKDGDIMVCFLVTRDDDNSQDILSKIDGEICPINELCNYTNINEIKQVYKLSNLKHENTLLDLVVSKMVTKSFVSN